MLHPVENTIKDFFNRFEIHATKIDDESAARLLASEIYLHHIYETGNVPVKDQSESLILAPKRRGRPQNVNVSKKSRAVKAKGAI